MLTSSAFFLSTTWPHGAQFLRPPFFSAKLCFRFTYLLSTASFFPAHNFHRLRKINNEIVRNALLSAPMVLSGYKFSDSPRKRSALHFCLKKNRFRLSDFKNRDLLSTEIGDFANLARCLHCVN